MFTKGRTLRGAQPLHHFIVNQQHPILSNEWLPVLWLFRADVPGSVPAPFLAMVNYCVAHSADSITTLRKPVRAFGFLYDYIVQCEQHYLERYGNHIAAMRSVVLSEFCNRLQSGTISLGSGAQDDPTGLHWPRNSSLTTLQGLAHGLDKFFDHLADFSRAGELEEAVKSLPVFGGTIVGYAATARRLKQLSFLSHLQRKNPEESERPRLGKGIFHRVGSSPAVGEETKQFPAHLVIPMITSAFIKREDAELTLVREDVTGKLNAALALGGHRQSESLHMWVNDLQIKDDKIFGFLRHPQKFKDGGGIRTRETILDEDFYGLLPRNRVSGRQHAGWKNPMLNGEFWALIKWLPVPGIHPFLIKLLLTYLQDVRRPVMAKRRSEGLNDHPYLLVSARHQPNQGNYIGDPYTMAASRGSWSRAVRRLAKRYPDEGIVLAKHNGTTRHGFRHRYGKFFQQSGASPREIQIFLHHVSVFSSLVYSASSVEEAHSKFETAAGIIRGELTKDEKAPNHVMSDILEEMVEEARKGRL